MTTKPIPMRSTAAAPKAKKITVFEFERDVVVAEVGAVEVFAVVVGGGSWAPPTSSLYALPPDPEAAAAAALAGTRARTSAPHSASSAIRELRGATPRVAIQRAYRHPRGDTPQGDGPP
jgi:hypothetical protein